MSDFRINILPVRLVKNQVDITITENEEPGFFQITKYCLPQSYPAKSETEIYWWSHLVNTDKLPTFKVNIEKDKRFGKKYLNRLIFEYFQERNLFTGSNFVNDTEVYEEDKSFTDTVLSKYHCYSLKIDQNCLVDGFSLLLSYDGDTFVTKRNLEQLTLEKTLVKKVLYKGSIRKYKYLNEKEITEEKLIYPVINPAIRKALNLPFVRNYSENKYLHYYERIQNFYEKWLKEKEINQTLMVLGGGFHQPNSQRINQVNDESNLLLFGNNQKNYNPYFGIKENGPLVSLSKRIKLLFIFHEKDKDLANKVYSYLKTGYRSFPGLEVFVNIKFDVDQARSLIFQRENPIDEIETELLQREGNPNKQFDPNETYAAIYISRIKKDDDNEDNDLVYYRLKELLLRSNITSQVIYRENILNPSFNFFLPNIAIALLAKLGGVPWRLYRPIKKDLVVGIGASRYNVNRYLGTAICFQNDGKFSRFNVFEKGDQESLVTGLKEAINEYIRTNQSCERLILHYYKKMSKEEEKPISKALEELNISIPYVVITINDTLSKDYVLFDDSFTGKMPQSGKFIKVKNNQYLLCNNTRYSQNTGAKIDGFPLPIKIHIKFSTSKHNEESIEIFELIDQVYQFSRMYWRSVRQRNLPVTIEYSEEVAKIYSRFINKDMNDFMKSTLWFL